MRGKPGARTPKGKKPNLAQAFGVEGTEPISYASSQQRLATSTSDGYVYATSSEIPGADNKAGVGAGPGRSRYGYPEPQVGVEASQDPSQRRGREPSLDQYGENVRLTTFPPRNGTIGLNERQSDDNSAEGAYPTYPQTPYPAPPQYGRRQY